MTTATANRTRCNVATFRNAYGALSQAFVSLRSARGADERNREAGWVRETLAELTALDCPRANRHDIDAAQTLISTARAYLVAHVL